MSELTAAEDYRRQSQAKQGAGYNILEIALQASVSALPESGETYVPSRESAGAARQDQLTFGRRVASGATSAWVPADHGSQLLTVTEALKV